jgi:hypothetical protein
MSRTGKTVSPKLQPARGADLPEAARRAWTVQFVVPPPQAMPSERLKARAELVRNAQGCTSCSSY